MKNLAIARRYAKALLLIGKEDDQVEAYQEELQRFANLLEEQTVLNQAITNPLYEAAGRRNLLQTLIQKLGLSKVMASYLMLLFDKAIEKIRAGLSQKTGKDVILEVEQDPNLIGGIVTKIGDLVLDGSIKTQLSNIRESLKRGEGI